MRLDRTTRSPDPTHIPDWRDISILTPLGGIHLLREVRILWSFNPLYIHYLALVIFFCFFISIFGGYLCDRFFHLLSQVFKHLDNALLVHLYVPKT